MGLGDRRYRQEVPPADQRLAQQVGVGMSNWFVDSHDAMPVYTESLVEAIEQLAQAPEPLGEEVPATVADGNGNGSHRSAERPPTDEAVEQAPTAEVDHEP